MPKVSPIQHSFNGGEISPLMYGRTDFDAYKNSMKTCINMIPMVQGPVTRRPGTYFVAEVKDSSKATRLVRFEFSTTQAYIIEFGNLYCRFYRDNGRIESPPGTAVEIVTPYLEADLFELKFAQSADVLYITHPLYQPRTLSRTAHTSWSLLAVTFDDGPYLAENQTATTLTPVATTGSNIQVDASAIAGINGGVGFRASDVGRVIRITHAAVVGWARIVTVDTTTQVHVNIGSAFGATTASGQWRLGIWNDTDGWPSCVTFFEDRLCFSGAPQAPQRIDGSVVGSYNSFMPTEADLSVEDDMAISFTLNSNDVQVVRWMTDDEKGLLVGTVRGEWVVRPSSQNEALTPTNVAAKQSTTHGSADIQVLRAAKAALFVQRAGRKLRELAYIYEVDGFKSPDMTVLAEHITLSGIKEIAYQQEPQSVIWNALNDGRLGGFTYEREQKVLAWHGQNFGGYSDAGRTMPALCESVACIPSAGGTRDELWVVVNRYIDGGTKRYVEYVTKMWERGDDQEDAFFVDAGLTYDGVPADVITGLDHLEGETVSILADGAVHPQKVVASGEVTLDYEASVVQIGLPYNSDAGLLRMDVGAADGTAQGKMQRTHRAIFRFHDTGGVKVGPNFTTMDRVTFRTTNDPIGAAVPLFTGDYEHAWDGDYTTENLVCLRWDQPLPGTLICVMPQLHTQDR
jgi:hypothetical protein